jgi:hypothetical protein
MRWLALKILAAFAIAVSPLLSLHVFAAVPEWRNATIVQIYADPGDIVLQLSGANGPCGSTLYHIQRANTNFKEFYAAMLTALALNKNVSVYVMSCSGDRNIVSHGSVFQ